MTRQLVLLAAAAILSCSLTATAQTEEERIERLLIERAHMADARPLPPRGMRMAQVEARFGAPREKRAPVGGDRPQHPPITRWVYADFSVYFEHDHVVSAVLNRVTPSERGPIPAQ